LTHRYNFAKPEIVKKYLRPVKEKFNLYKTKFYGFSTPVRLSFVAGALLVCAIIISLVNSHNAEEKWLYAQQFVSPSWGCIGSCPSGSPSQPESGQPIPSTSCTTPALSQSPSGNTYYVAPNGSDSNNGSESSPFQTIQKGADVAQPGDTVLVHGGSYDKFSVPTSGTQAQPITFRANPGEQPVISAPGNTAIVLSGVSFIIVDGLTSNGSGDGIIIQGAGSGNNHILNCEVAFSGGTGIGIQDGAHDNLVKNCRIHDNVQDNFNPRGRASMWGAGMTARHQAINNVFEDNYIYWNNGEGTSAFDASDGSVWRRNVIADNWGENLYVDGSKDDIIEGNLIYLSPEAKNWNSNFNNNAEGIGVSVEPYDSPPSTRDSTGLKISNNIVVNTARGLSSFVEEGGHTFSGWVVTNNTFINNDEGIFLHGPTTGNTFRNNIILGGSPVAGVESPSGSSTLSNNIYFGNSESFQWGQTTGNFAQWQGSSGDATSQWADPMLQNPSAIPPRFWSDPSLPAPSAIVPLSTLVQQYQLAAGSPAKKASDTGGEVGAYGGTNGGIQAGGQCGGGIGTPAPQPSQSVPVSGVPSVIMPTAPNGGNGGGGTPIDQLIQLIQQLIQQIEQLIQQLLGGGQGGS
jgi:parallel beta-helix repeat protein